MSRSLDGAPGSKVTVAALQAMKREGRKIVGVVAWDTETARVVDRAGVDIVSVGDSVAVSLWGRDAEGQVAVDEMLVVCSAVARGVRRALVSCDLPSCGTANGCEKATRLVSEGGAEMVKVAGVASVASIASAGIPVFASIVGGVDPAEEAKRLEGAGASLIDFRHSGAADGQRVVEAVSIPVIGGLGGGPWLDGRMRAVYRLLDDGVAAYARDVRAGRPVKGD
jgi:3-methyl-2-oxobutanoate hydroxymethyltransferase